MPIPLTTSSSAAESGPKLEESFQPILPKVDHILSLIREHQEQLRSAEGSSDGNDRRGQKGVVDLEDKIIKEASATRLLLNAQKTAAHDLPGGHLSLREVNEGIKKMDKEIERNKAILANFEGRIQTAEVINRIS